MTHVAHEDVEPIARRVFVSHDAYGRCFTGEIEARALVCPVNFDFSGRDLSAFAAAAAQAGDSGFYESRIERGSDPDYPEDWYISLDALDAYAETSMPLQNILVSPSARWGVIFSEEAHALIGGSTQFVDTFFTHSGRNRDEQVGEFTARWRLFESMGSDISWMPSFLDYVRRPPTPRYGT